MDGRPCIERRLNGEGESLRLRARFLGGDTEIEARLRGGVKERADDRESDRESERGRLQLLPPLASPLVGLQDTERPRLRARVRETDREREREREFEYERDRDRDLEPV